VKVLSHSESSLPLVLYEDNHILAIHKPSGMAVQGESPSLLEWSKQWLKEKYKKPGNVFVGCVHRLDKKVAGVVVVAKTSKGAARLSEQFRTSSVEKTYRAVVEGHPPRKRMVLEQPILVEDGRVTISEGEGKLGKLEFQVLEDSEKRSLLEIRLHSGRKHQIRVQLASQGCPILGDKLYGAKSRLPGGAIALVATRLQFKHPTSDKRIVVEVDSDHLQEWLRH